MYLPAGKRVVALDGVTGIGNLELRFAIGRSRRNAAWPTGRAISKRRRTSCFTTGSKLVAVNAKTGKLDPGFGNEGQVEMVVPYSGGPNHI